MEIFIIVILAIIIVILICFSESDKEKISESSEVSRLKEDFKEKEFDLLSEDASLEYIHKEIYRYIDKIEKQLQKKYDLSKEKEIEYHFKYVKEKLNDMEVVVKTELCQNNSLYNLKQNVQELIRRIKASKKKKIELIISEELNHEFFYDNYKLISVLRLIIMKSFEKGSQQVKIMAEYIKEENNNRVEFKISNIQFSNEKSLYTNNEIFAYLSLKTISPEVLLFNLEPEFLIIRQNLLYITKNVEFKEENNQFEITFEMNV